MKKLLLVAVAGLSVLAGSLQAKKVCDMIEKSAAYTVDGRCEEVITGPEFKCPDVVCPACPSVNVPACMCEAPKKVECNCTPNITVKEECHEVCTSCHQLKADCGCHKGGHRHHGRHKKSVDVVYE